MQQTRVGEAEGWYLRAEKLAPGDASVYRHYGMWLCKVHQLIYELYSYNYYIPNPAFLLYVHAFYLLDSSVMNECVKIENSDE